MTDLAVVQISGSNLPIANLGDSSQLQVGDWVVAIGNAVVGINTLVAGQAEPGVPAQGIGFAISIAAAKPIADQLVATSKVVYPYLGISDISLSPAIAAQLGISEKEGIIIRCLGRGSPADQAGLLRYDVVTAVDGKALPGDSDLQRILRDHKPGDTLMLTVIRGTHLARII